MMGLQRHGNEPVHDLFFVGRYRALLLDNLDGYNLEEGVSFPNPEEDEDAFLQFLA